MNCAECGKPTIVSKEQALALECTGIHFLQEGKEIVPIQSHGLRVGSHSIMKEVKWGIDVRVGNHCDLFRCTIGAHTKIKHYVEVQEGVEIGKFCKIESFAFIPTGVKIGNYVFVGPHVAFTNDKYPSATGPWTMKYTEVEDNVSIGAGCVILPGVKIGKDSLIGAGAIITKNVPQASIYYGRLNAAKMVRPL